MRRALLLVSVLLCVGMAQAQNSHRAIVINQTTRACGMIGFDANGDPTFGGFGTVTQALQNSNKVRIVCHGDGITNLSGSGQEYSGFGCALQNPEGNIVYITFDSHATDSENGEAELHCTFKLN